MRYIKGKIYKKVIKFICKFPFVVKIFYNLFKNLIIYFPFLRASYKWRMIRTDYLDFEVERNLVKKGKLKNYNELFNITYYPGNDINEYREFRKTTGEYNLGISPKGLRITGKVKTKDIDFVFLKINSNTVKKFNVIGLDRFALTIKKGSLGKFPKKSVLTVELYNGLQLIYGKSNQVQLTVPFGDGKLEKTIDEGFFLSKKGTIITSNDSLDLKREKYLNLYILVKDLFDNEIGTPLFLTYGTLLGYTREGDFIANDDDFDAGYVSEKPNPKEVKKEALDIILKLLRLGFNISINPVGRLFKISNGTGVSLDVMPVWFEKEWNVAYRGACVKSTVDDYLPSGTGIMRGHEVYVPKESEKFLAGYYGESWKTPDPGYVSNFEQTGKVLLKNYHSYLLTPLEFIKINNLINIERILNPDIGKFSSSALRGVLKF